MRRGLLLTGLVLAGLAGSARADYLKIIVNLASSKDRTLEAQPGGGAGMMPGGIGGMMPGGAGGMMPGGGLGGPGGAGGRGAGMAGGEGGGYPGGPGGAGAGGQIPGALGGGQGPGAGGPGRGGPGGGRPGFGGPGGGGRGLGSADGEDPAGGMGLGAGMGGMGPGGMMPDGGGAGGLGGEIGDGDEPDSSPFFVEAVVEIDSKYTDKAKGWVNGLKIDAPNSRLYVKHKLGQTAIPLPADIFNNAKRVGQSTILTSSQLQLIYVVHEKHKSVADLFDDKRKALDSKDSTPELIMQTADWALMHGLVPETSKTIDKLAVRDPKHPAVLAFAKINKELDKALPEDPAAMELRKKLGEDFKVKSTKHYTLLYDSGAEGAADKRLMRLEENMRAFYYWFALKGQVIAMPEKKLLGALYDTKDAFEHHHKDVFDAIPMTVDGYFVPRDQLAVYSAKRLDESYEGLSKVGGSQIKQWDRNVLLAGGGWNSRVVPNQVVASAQTYALLLQTLEDESERTTVSHEGTRQLLRASGLIPKGVKVPEWLDNGLASFFETPHGAFWPGTGAPSWSYLVKYKSWEATKKLDKPEEAIRKVVTDRYFLDAEANTDKAAEDKAERKARTMAWALTFFLLKEKPEGLKRYLEEVATLPRDLTIDEETLFGCFARAFDLYVDANRNPPVVDNNKLTSLANKWTKFMGLTNLEATEVMNREISNYKKNLAANKPVGGAQQNPNQQPGAGPGGAGFGPAGGPGGAGGRGGIGGPGGK